MNRKYSNPTSLLALDLLATPLNVPIFRSLEQDSLSLLELRQATGSPPQSTMRVYLRSLEELGIIDRLPQRSVGYRLTGAGKDLLGVAKVLERWLRMAPREPISLGTTASKSATKALVEGWTTKIVRAMATRAFSLTELNEVFPKINYPSLERRVSSMRLAGLVESQSSEKRGTHYGATDWLRHAVVPVTASAAWAQQNQPPGLRPISRLGVEAVFLLVLPLLEMGASFSGRFQLAVEVQRGNLPILAGVSVAFREGAVASCSTRLEGQADTRISGYPSAWLRRMKGVKQVGLDLNGDLSAAEELLEGLIGVGKLAAARHVSE